MDTKQLVAKAREIIVGRKELAWLVLDIDCSNHNECRHSETAFDEMVTYFDIDEVMQGLVADKWTFVVSEDDEDEVEWLFPKCSDPEWQPPEGFLKSEGGDQ